MALNELEKAKNRLEELKQKRRDSGHLSQVEQTEASKLSRMITAAESK